MADQATEQSTSTRITQRQLIDAIAKLDEAFRPSTSTSSSSLRSSSDTTCPARKRSVQNFASTACMSKLTTPSCSPRRPRPASGHHSTAALEALLPTSSHHRGPASDCSSLPKPPTYEPTSLRSLISRIRTYRSTTFTPGKPSPLDALHCALLGWVSHKTQRDQIECTTCHALLSVAPLPSPHTWSSEPGRLLAQTYEAELRLAHLRTCPWRVKGASLRLYRLPQWGRKALIQELGQQAKELQQTLGDLHGLTLQGPSREPHRVALRHCLDILQQGLSNTDETTREHLLLALFGWSAPTTTPVPSAPSTTPILECRYCTRTVLLAPHLSTPSKPFDLIQQHQSFCPYVSNPPIDDVGLVSLVQSKAGWETRIDTILQRKSRGGATSNSTPTGSQGSNNESLGAFEWLNKKHTSSTIASEDASGPVEIVTTGQTRELLNHVRTLLGPRTSPSRTRVQ
ncbi:BZ3500_MvSof-1268-A1-R1_Chr3-2g06349 [Microbotryum saponariae]|uniref:BZ3500_MvSof-1268-A1-R1_Chr3-2g06349 protein n=1 Tax=Microbotryum saponariae TaxID=289078 RepID=A0A2X0KZ84_9BASI|nr:BZ3500_MvSof-1268-A1-R1_Chr3-2g06349 [Microbotryum saponariae]SDA04320.1 BZ3501_MvSof-1269-A2-R1_Chr3-2g06040 [Microbotryum saponariae]